MKEKATPEGAEAYARMLSAVERMETILPAIQAEVAALKRHFAEQEAARAQACKVSRPKTVSDSPFARRSKRVVNFKRREPGGAA